jgi:hypothetical protein
MKKTKITFPTGMIAATLVLGGCIAAGPNSSVTTRGEAGIDFPRVTGVNLEGEEIALPSGFQGERNLVAVAFKRGQQAKVDTWIAELDRLAEADPEMRFYELPTIYEANALFRMWVNNGMRSGIQDPVARKRTITLYLDREKFMAELAIPDMDDIHLFLLDRRGQVVWRAAGSADEAKLASLDEALGYEEMPGEPGVPDRRDEQTG